VNRVIASEAASSFVVNTKLTISLVQWNTNSIDVVVQICRDLLFITSNSSLERTPSSPRKLQDSLHEKCG